ncbi:GOR [Symbiodinium natans]|uniref:GOR protein n=1 Tax=Symbiodinium natans TaxID=878477 RepID=A0A812KYA2_9DINO|nr:GOR [Symbiodinium natans]
MLWSSCAGVSSLSKLYWRVSAARCARPGLQLLADASPQAARWRHCATCGIIQRKYAALLTFQPEMLASCLCTLTSPHHAHRSFVAGPHPCLGRNAGTAVLFPALTPALRLRYARTTPYNAAIRTARVCTARVRAHAPVSTLRIRAGGCGPQRQIAFLPAACGGLGLASAERLAPAAYWAAWADALPVMLQRRPEIARRYAQELALGGGSTAPCLRAAAEAGDRLLAEGWRARPEWDALLHGARPPPTHAEPSEPGSWPHGWQKPAVCALNKSYRERLLCNLSPSSRTLLRSQAGAHAGEWLRAIPTDEGTQFLPLDMQVALRRRLRLPLPMASSRCGGHGEPGCRAVVDQLGDHRAACARSGLREAVAAEGRVVGGRWGQEAHDLVRDLAQQRSLRAPRALRAAARSGRERWWWGQLGCALQRALASTLLGGCWRVPAQPTGDEGTPLGWILAQYISGGLLEEQAKSATLHGLPGTRTPFGDQLIARFTHLFAGNFATSIVAILNPVCEDDAAVLCDARHQNMQPVWSPLMDN